MTTTTYHNRSRRRRRRSPQERAQLEREALERALSSESWGNYPAIVQGFADKGIPESDIRPRENVFTYHAWRALGRQVRKGEHGVRVTTFIITEGPCRVCQGRMITCSHCESTGRYKGRRMAVAYVFHESQTDPRENGGGS